MFHMSVAPYGKREDYVYVKGVYQSTLQKYIIIWDVKIR